MRRTALHEYLGQIEGLLDDNRLPEAAAHCHFILQQYPRHIETYRLLGRALLEQQLYDEAADVFERLLSADPEDLISHAGLALAYSESRDLERAIWHMERAFDVDPYNRAVQDELRKLYMARDGDAPPRLSLTKAALARLHLKAALYRQAIGELARLVRVHPERIDLRLALADALYLDSRVAEAAELSHGILETLPFCIKANAIMADAWLRDERVDEAREHLRRVQALTMLERTQLDTDTTLGRALGNARITIPDSVSVEILEDTMAIAKEFEETGAWPEQAAAVLVDSEEVPDWLLEIGSPDAPLVSESQVEPEAVKEPAEIMDWLDEALAAETVSSEIQDADPDSTYSHEETEDGLTDDGLKEDPPVADALATAVAMESVEPSDEERIVENWPIMEVDDSLATSEVVQGEMTAGIIDEDEQPDISESDPDAPKVADELAIWDDESLLALDDLKAYIDADGDPAPDDAEAPEWLGELDDRSEVADELPQWLHEAVGLDTGHQNQTEDQISQPKSKAAAPIGDGQLGDDSAITGYDKLSETTEAERDLDSGFLETDLPAAPTADGVPDWLLEGEGVLDELPESVLHTDVSGTMEGDGSEDNTSTWLDELSEQLSMTDAKFGAQDNATSDTVEGEQDGEQPE